MTKWLEISQTLLLCVAVVLLTVIVVQQRILIEAQPLNQLNAQARPGGHEEAELRAPIVRPILPDQFTVKLSVRAGEEIPVSLKSPASIDVNVVRDTTRP